jgi:hypothetical protein
MAPDAYEAARDTNVVCILTEWEEFRSLDYGLTFGGTLALVGLGA